MERQLVTVVVILDLSAASDTVDHDLLLEVLKKQYGVVGAARQWYTSYLKPRTFRVSIRGTTSQFTRLLCATGISIRSIPIHSICIHTGSSGAA